MFEAVKPILEQHQALVDTYNAAKAEFAGKMKTSFNDIFKEFFDNTPEVHLVIWNQYTPYFNDGDPCEFRVSDRQYIASKILEDEDSEDLLGDIDNASAAEDSDYHFYVASYGKEKAFELVGEQAYINTETLEKLLNSIPDDIYEDVFDDHVTVKVTRDGIEVDEYSHD